MGALVVISLELRGDPWKPAELASRFNCIQAEHAFDEVIAVNQLLRRFQPVWWKTWFWIGPYETTVSSTGCKNDRLLDFRGSLISTGMSNLGATSDRTANDITDESIGFVSFDGIVGAVVVDRSLLDGLVERFQKAGKMLELVHKEQLQIEGLSATFALYKVNYPNKP
jgi:hypothetical protein